MPRMVMWAILPVSGGDDGTWADVRLRQRAAMSRANSRVACFIRNNSRLLVNSPAWRWAVSLLELQSGVFECDFVAVDLADVAADPQRRVLDQAVKLRVLGLVDIAQHPGVTAPV